MRSVRLLPVLGVVAVFAIALEIVWRVKFGMGSPAIGLLYVVAAIPIGWVAQRFLCAESREPTTGEAFFGGTVVLAWLYCALLAVGARSLFPFAAVVIALASLIKYPLRALVAKDKTVSLGVIAQQALVGALVIRNAAYAEHLPLAKPAPVVFGWVDTSFWLNNSYGIERGLPVRDILVKDGTLNYHFGSSFLTVTIRSLTGVPMHIAHVIAVAACCWSLAVLLARAAERIIGAKSDGLVVWCAPFVAIAWEEKILFNFPLTYALPLAVYVLLRFSALRSLRSALLLIPAMALLAMAKESLLLFVGIFVGVMGLAAWVRNRDWKRVVLLMVSGVLAKLVYAKLVEHGQHAYFTIFREHLSLSWIAPFLDEGFGVNSAIAGSPGFRHSALWTLLIVIAFAFFAWRLRHSDRRRSFVLASGVLLYCFGFGMLCLLQPHHRPEYDWQHAGWVMGDMFQFFFAAQDIVVVIAALIALGIIDEAIPNPSTKLIAAAISALAFYNATHTFMAPDPQRDIAQPVMERIPVAGTITLTSIPPIERYPFNEYPDLAGYYGHQFYLLRHGRWATAHPRFKEMEEIQTQISTTDDRARALELARREGITHLVCLKWSIPPWLRQTSPTFTNDAWSAFDLRMLPN